MIEISHLEFRFPRSPTPFFRNLNFHVGRGERLALIGPSGCGKTTLFQIIAGLLPFQRGHLRLASTRVEPGGETIHTRLRNHEMGLIFQDYYLLEDLTVVENLRLRLAIAGRRKESEDMDGWLRLVGLEHMAQAKTSSLSGGQRQRLVTARALITRPRVILADEPTGNLDDRSAGYVIDLLATQPEETSLLIATHDRRILDRFPRHLSFENLRSQP